MSLVFLRAVVFAGGLLFVAGGWIAWYDESSPGLGAMRAHEFAGVVGEWAWLTVAPMLAAAVAPYRGAWARWLWLTALAPLAAALIVLTIDPVSLVTFPFSAPFGGRSAWLIVSLTGASLALAGLVAVRFVVRPGAPDPLAGRWQVPAVVAVLTLALVAIPLARGPRDTEREAQLVKLEAGGCDGPARAGAPAPQVRVECRDPLGQEPWCAWEVRCPDGSVSGGSGSGYYGPV